nr:SpoIID/LytB domain-containing protein [Symbiobacterium terraclitae]
MAAVVVGAVLLAASAVVPGAWIPTAAAGEAVGAVPAPPSENPVRVGLAWGQWAAEVSASAGLWIVADGAVQGQVDPGVPVGLVVQDGGVYVDAIPAWFAGAVRLVPDPAGYIRFQGREYRGEIEAVPTAAGTLSIVNVVNLEDYLLAVVPAEMDHTWPLEALKAQAVAARSYTLANLGKRAADGFDLRNNTDDQVYYGIAYERPSTTQAVHETAGQVVTYQGRVVSTHFHSSSGGHTENNEDIWTGGTPVAYLRGVIDYDDVPGNRYTSWDYEFSIEEFSQRLNQAGYAVGSVTSVTPGAPGASGRPTTWVVTGTGGTRTLTMQQMRMALGLPAPPSSVSLAGPGFDPAGPEPQPEPEPEPDPEPEPEPEPEPQQPQPQPQPQPEPRPEPQPLPVAVVGADGLVMARAVSGSFAVGAGGVARLLDGPVAVAGGDAYGVAGIVPRTGSATASRGERPDPGTPAQQPPVPEQPARIEQPAPQQPSPQQPTPQQPTPQQPALREPQAPTSVVITGSGHGHGVGLSQWGAHGMALQGKTYVEILTHYYTGTKVETR